MTKPSLAAFCLLLLAIVPAFAQVADIAGTVTDPTGAGIPQATVTLKATSTGVTRSAETDAAGTYSVPNVPIGSYDVTVQKTGFQSLQFHDVTLNVAQNLTLNGTMQLGAVSASVDVQGETVPTIDLEDAQISNLVDKTRIVELPLITRDPYSLVLLSTGTSTSTSSLGGFSVNGQRDRSNNFLLDGLDNNDASVPGAPGGISTINPDSTQEFRVITNNYLPEYGRNSGALVDVATDSGTNQFHGDAYEFHRDRALAARDYFNPTGTPQNPFVYNDFGASLGGPIMKDKTFFFVNTDWTRIRQSLQNTANVPTAAFKSGVFNYNGQHIDLSTPGSANNILGLPLDPTMQKLFAAYPNPNGPAVNDIVGVYNFSTPIPTNSANTTFRIDHTINEKYSLFARYIYNGNETGNSIDETLPGIGGVSQTGQTHNIAVGLIAAFRPDLVNDFRAGLNRVTVPFACNGVNTINQYSSPDAFGAGSDYNFTTGLGNTISNFGCGALGDSNGQARRAGTWELRDQVSIIKGNHSIKAGVESRYVFENGYDAFSTRPVVDFSSFYNLGIPSVGNCSGACQNDPVLQTLGAALLGVVGVQSQSQYFNAQGTRTATDFRQFVQHEYGAFVQDSWKLRHNLTIEVGLRYEFDGVPFERNGNLSNLLNQLPWTPGDKTFQLVGPGTGNQMYNNGPYDFEPRVGLAWDPFSDGKTSFRMGYGIFHDRVFGNLFSNLKTNPPFVGSVYNLPNTDFANGVGNPVTLASLTTPATLPAPSATIPEGSYFSGATLIDPNLKTPYTQSWNAGIQRQLAKSTTLSIDYVASTTHRLFRSVDGNPPLPSLVSAAHADGSLPRTVSGGALREAPALGYPQVTGNTDFIEPILIKSIGNATYNSLQVGFVRQLQKDIQFQASYTWAHAIDDAGDPLAPGAGNRSVARNSFNLQEERGNSDYDVRHRLVLNFIAQLPFGPGHAHLNNGLLSHVLGGWELSGLSTAQSGHPYTVYSTRDSEWTGLANRPDLVASGLTIPQDAPRNQFGPTIAAVAIQPFGRPGTLGRNVFVGPKYFDTDASLIKNTKIGERVTAQFRAEVFNVFNHVLFAQPDNVITDRETFGQSLSTLTQPDGTTSARQIQLALKVIF